MLDTISVSSTTASPFGAPSWFETQLPWGGTELHVEVSLSKILNPNSDVQLAPLLSVRAL